MKKVNANGIHQRLNGTERIKGWEKPAKKKKESKRKIQLIYIYLICVVEMRLSNFGYSICFMVNLIRLRFLLMFAINYQSDWLLLVSSDSSTDRPTNQPIDPVKSRTTKHFHNFQYRKYVRFNRMINPGRPNTVYMSIAL